MGKESSTADQKPFVEFLSTLNVLVETFKTHEFKEETAPKLAPLLRMMQALLDADMYQFGRMTTLQAFVSTLYNFPTAKAVSIATQNSTYVATLNGATFKAIIRDPKAQQELYNSGITLKILQASVALHQQVQKPGALAFMTTEEANKTITDTSGSKEFCVDVAKREFGESYRALNALRKALSLPSKLSALFSSSPVSPRVTTLLLDKPEATVKAGTGGLVLMTAMLHIAGACAAHPEDESKVNEEIQSVISALQGVNITEIIKDLLETKIWIELMTREITKRLSAEEAVNFENALKKFIQQDVPLTIDHPLFTITKNITKVAQILAQYIDPTYLGDSANDRDHQMNAFVQLNVFLKTQPPEIQKLVRLATQQKYEAMIKLCHENKNFSADDYQHFSCFEESQESFNKRVGIAPVVEAPQPVVEVEPKKTAIEDDYHEAMAELDRYNKAFKKIDASMTLNAFNTAVSSLPDLQKIKQRFVEIIRTHDESVARLAESQAALKAAEAEAKQLTAQIEAQKPVITAKQIEESSQSLHEPLNAAKNAAIAWSYLKIFVGVIVSFVSACIVIGFFPMRAFYREAEKANRENGLKLNPWYHMFERMGTFGFRSKHTILQTSLALKQAEIPLQTISTAPEPVPADNSTDLQAQLKSENEAIQRHTENIATLIPEIEAGKKIYQEVLVLATGTLLASESIETMRQEISARERATAKPVLLSQAPAPAHQSPMKRLASSFKLKLGNSNTVR